MSGPIMLEMAAASDEALAREADWARLCVGTATPEQRLAAINYAAACAGWEARLTVSALDGSGDQAEAARVTTGEGVREQAARAGGDGGQDRKFAFRDGLFVNRVSGEPIPADEPVIIFRAHDWHALDVLAFYQRLADDPHHVRAIQDRMNEFQAYKDEHPERMKEPGITRHIRLNDEGPAEFSDAASAEIKRACEAIIGDLGSADMDGYYTGTVHQTDVKHLEQLLAALPATTQGADVLGALLDDVPDTWAAQGYKSREAEIADMANVGRALMEALPKGYSYNDCPSEIVADLINERDEALAAAPHEAGEASDLPPIPAHMTRWHGENSAPDDWDGGPVLLRDGTTWNMAVPGSWRHIAASADRDTIAYTRKSPTAPAGDGLGVREAELQAAGWAAGMQDAANICGSLAGTTFDDADGFAAATGCEAAIVARIARANAALSDPRRGVEGES